jgi:hypothetical protein
MVLKITTHDELKLLLSNVDAFVHVSSWWRLPK